MRRNLLLISLVILAFLTEGSPAAKAQGFSFGGEGLSIGGSKKKKHYKKKKQYKKKEHHKQDDNHDASVGIGITIDPAKLLESGKKKKPEKKASKKPSSNVKKSAVETKDKSTETKLGKTVPVPVTPGTRPGSTDLPAATTTRGKTPCPLRLVSTSDTDFERERAGWAEKEAASYRKWAKRWRELAGKAKDGAKFAKKSGLGDSQEWHEGKAKELEERAAEYERKAAQKDKEAKERREKADAEDRKEAEREKKRCEKYQTALREKKAPPMISTPATASKPENQSSSSSQSSAPANRCGPDITDNVLRVLDKMHNDWKRWNSSKKAEKCRDLLNPLTALGAWDIVQLSPDVAPLSKDDYEDAHGGTKGYDNYLKGKFWFEGSAAACAKPRPICGPTVTFLGQCIHSQVVNYIQWGTVNQLCDQQWSAGKMHAVYSAMAPDHIYDGQQVMAEIGTAYTKTTAAGGYYTFQSADPGELDSRRDYVKKQMESKLRKLMADPSYADFAKRPETACSMPCTMTAAERKKLEKKTMTYRWGVGSVLGVGGR